MASPAPARAPGAVKSVLPADAVRALCEGMKYDALQGVLRDALFVRHCPFVVDLVEAEAAHVPVIYEDVRRAFLAPATQALNSNQLRRAYTRAVYLLLRIYQDGYAYCDTFPTPGDDLFSRYAMVHAKVVGWIAAYAAATEPPISEVRRGVRELIEASTDLPNPLYVPYMGQATFMGVALRQHISYNSAAITPDAVRPTQDNPKLIESQRKGMVRFLAFLDRCDDWAALWNLEAVPRFSDDLLKASASALPTAAAPRGRGDPR